MVTFLGPLTTAFTPPASCFSSYYRDHDANDVVLLNEPECFPTNFAASGFYSPGLSCPSGYEGITSNDGIQTSVNCCPKQYEFSGPWPGVCTTTEFGSLITVLVTGYSTSPSISTQLYGGSDSFVGPISASVIQLRFQASDLGSSSTGFASATASGTSSDTPSSGLSRGAKIAIGVTVPVAIVLMVTVIIIMFVRYRKMHSRGGSMNGQEKYPKQQETYYEMPTPREPTELEGQSSRES